MERLLFIKCEILLSDVTFLFYFWEKGKNLFNPIQFTKERPEAHNSTKYSYLPKVADQQSHDIPKVSHPFH